MEFGLSGVRVWVFSTRMARSIGMQSGKTLPLLVLLQAKIKGYMRELDMCSLVADAKGIYVVSKPSSIQFLRMILCGIILRADRVVPSGVVESDRCNNEMQLFVLSASQLDRTSILLRQPSISTEYHRLPLLV
jgi:hypothetical protein